LCARLSTATVAKQACMKASIISSRDSERVGKSSSLMSIRRLGSVIKEPSLRRRDRFVLSCLQLDENWGDKGEARGEDESGDVVKEIDEDILGERDRFDDDRLREELESSSELVWE
jgi:hypothetical protein